MDRTGAPDSHPVSSKPPSSETFFDRALVVLTQYVSPPTARSILNLAEQRGGEGGAAPSDPIASIERSLRLFMTDPAQVVKCRAALEALVSAAPQVDLAVAVPIRGEDDIVNARIEGRRAAASAGFTTIGITRLVTAISEVARNIVLYAGQGQIEILPSSSPRGVEIIARDRGPGIGNLDQILAGNYKSRQGMGLGLRGVKKLAERFEIQTAPGAGTTVRFVVRVA